MRKALSVVIIPVIFVFMVSVTVSAAGKEVNVLGAIGAASSGFEDLLVDFGVEFKLVGEFYLCLLANSHFGSGREYYHPSYYYSFGPGISFSGTTLHGLNSYGVYKLSLSRKTKFFAKAGLSFIFYSAYDFDPDLGKWQKSSDRSGFGAGFGTGIEFIISDKAGLVLGTTYTTLFRENTNTPAVDWFNFYGGINYRVK